MPPTANTATRTALIWAGLALALAMPIVAAAMSPLLAWRQPVYIVAGFAGVGAMALLVLQPLLAGAYLPGLGAQRSRGLHRAIGLLLLVFILVHVGGLWLTSPPDVVDALLLRSPTPFSLWGVIAMWVLFAAVVIALFHQRLGLSQRDWRRVHGILAGITVAGSVAHALLIEGTMETLTKILLCALAVLATLKVLADRRIIGPRRRR